MSISIIYAVATLFSLLLLLAYFVLIKKKETWFFVLFTAVPVVNLGYFWLSVSETLKSALWANRVSYLGSVFLPLSMLMIILRVLKVRYCKRLPGILLLISMVVFLVAASPGCLDIYYRKVSLTKMNGATALIKEYGPWHKLYYLYLAAYFISMLICIACKYRQRKLEDNLHSTILAAAVFVNIGVWLMGQLVDVNFEFLSISYVMTSVFILFLKLLQIEFLKIQDDKIKLEKMVRAKEKKEIVITAEQLEQFCANRNTLTVTEKKIYDLHLQEKTTRDILQILEIKENTLKFHNKNIYSKLGVSSRKELLEIALILKEKQ